MQARFNEPKGARPAGARAAGTKQGYAPHRLGPEDFTEILAVLTFVFSRSEVAP